MTLGLLPSALIPYDKFSQNVLDITSNQQAFRLRAPVSQTILHVLAISTTGKDKPSVLSEIYGGIFGFVVWDHELFATAAPHLCETVPWIFKTQLKNSYVNMCYSTRKYNQPRTSVPSAISDTVSVWILCYLITDKRANPLNYLLKCMTFK